MSPRKTKPRTVGQRLKAARSELGTSQAEMAQELGLAQSTLADYELDKYAVGRDMCLALEYKFGINHEWILTGRGRPLLTSAPQPAGSALVSRPILITDKSELERLDNLEGRDRYYAVPYMRDAAAAGSGRIIEDEIQGYCIIHERVAPRPENLRCVRVSGDSMAPAITDGSIVAVDITIKNLRQADGKMVCARASEEEVVIKRLRLRGDYAILFSANEDQDKFPPIIVDINQQKDFLIGQVVWAWVDLR